MSTINKKSLHQQQLPQNEDGIQNQRADLFDHIDDNQYVRDDPDDIKILTDNNNTNAKFWTVVFIVIIISVAATLQLIALMKDHATLIQKQSEDQTLNFKQFSEQATQELKKSMDALDDKIRQIKQHGVNIQYAFDKQLNGVSKSLQSLKQDTQIINKSNQNQKYENQIEINSKILQHSSSITKFFNKEIISFKLLYRASENEFMVSKFHQKCDNIPNTLTLILTQHDKIIGGFTNLNWDRNHEATFEKDQKNETFIFSVNMGQKFQITHGSEVIKNYRDFGPVFAGTSGPADLIIFDRSNVAQRSFAQLPNNYNNEKKYQHSRETTELFVGSINQRFRIKQWEVFEVKFK